MNVRFDEADGVIMVILGRVGLALIALGALLAGGFEPEDCTAEGDE